jgi:hypothetical protein
MFADVSTPPSIMASKCGNLNAVVALQDDGSFDCLSRDMETGLNAAQFAMMNGHDHIVQRIMYDLHPDLGVFLCSSVPRSLPNISVIVANTSSFGDTSLHILVIQHRGSVTRQRSRLTCCCRRGPIYPMTSLPRERCNLSVLETFRKHPLFLQSFASYLRFFAGFGLKCGACNCDGLTAGDIATVRHMPKLLSVLSFHHAQQIQARYFCIIIFT